MPTPSGTQACSHARGRVRRARYPCPSPIAPRRIQHSLRQRSFMSSQCITTCCTYRPLARPMPSILWAAAASSTVTRMPQSAACRCATQPKIFTYSISWPKWERFIARAVLALALPHDNRTECPLARVLRWGGYWTRKDPCEVPLFYHADCFAVLGQLLQLFRHWSNEPETDTQAQLIEHLGTAIGTDLERLLTQWDYQKALRHIHQAGRSDAARQQHTHTWFDGFRLLKIIHLLRDHHFPNLTLNEAMRSPDQWPGTHAGTPTAAS